MPWRRRTGTASEYNTWRYGIKSYTCIQYFTLYPPQETQKKGTTKLPTSTHSRRNSYVCTTYAPTGTCSQRGLLPGHAIKKKDWRQFQMQHVRKSYILRTHFVPTRDEEKSNKENTSIYPRSGTAWPGRRPHLCTANKTQNKNKTTFVFHTTTSLQLITVWMPQAKGG